MKKAEKTQQTYNKILKAAMIEFGTKTYETASVNSICNEHQISKGLIYHNFKNKDDLYLCCVRACFQEITQFMEHCDYQEDTMEDGIRKLLDFRQDFFDKNPCYRNIFFNAILQPPLHLQNELLEIRSESDKFYRKCYHDLLSKIELRDGISMDMAVEYFIIFQEMFNGYFQNKVNNSTDYHSLIKDHEMNISRLLDIMLYGITKK